MQNFEKLGLKASDKNTKKNSETIAVMDENFDKIETEFK